MRVTILFGLIFTAGVVALADGNALKGGDKMKEPSIAKALPKAYATYEEQPAQGNGTNNACASLTLLSQAKQSLRQSPKII